MRKVGRKWVGLSLLVGISTWWGFTVWASSRVHSEVEKLSEFYAERRWDSVRTSLLKCDKLVGQLGSISERKYWLTVTQWCAENRREEKRLLDAIVYLEGSESNGDAEVKAHLLLAKSRQLFNNQKHIEALKLLQESEEKAKSQSALFKAVWYGMLTQLLERNEEYDRAEDVNSRVVSLLQGNSNLATRHAIALYNLGSFYTRRRNIDRAIENYQRVIEIAVAAKHPERPLIARVHQSLGLAYHNRRNNKAAILSVKKALTLYKQLFKEDNLTLAYCYDDLGYVLTGVENDSALHYVKLGMQLRERLFKGPNIELARSYQSMGVLNRHLGHNTESIHYYQKSNDIIKQVNPRDYELGICHNAMAECYRDLHDFSAALKHHAMALELFTDSTYSLSDSSRLPKTSQFVHPFYGVETMNFMTFTHHYAKLNGKSLHHSEEVLKCAELAIALSDVIWADYELTGEKTVLSDYMHDLLGNAVYHAETLYGVSKNDHYTNKALYFSERRKAALLVEAMSEMKGQDTLPIPEDLLLAEREAKLKLAYWQGELDAVRTHPERNKDKGENELMMEWIKAQEHFDSLSAHIQERYPARFKQNRTQGRIDLTKVMDELQDSVTYLEYVFRKSDEEGPHDLFVLKISKEESDLVRISVDTTFEAVCDAYKKAILDKDYDAFVEQASFLYQTMIAPLGGLNQRLVIVPDGPLHYLSFEALLTEKPNNTDFKDYSLLPYLVKNHSVSYANSLEFLDAVNRFSSSDELTVLGLAPFAE